MKPRLAIEAGIYKNSDEKYTCYEFKIKNENSEQWEDLIIKAKKRVAIGYLHNNKSTEIGDNQSWVNALLSAAIANDFDDLQPKRFELLEADGEYWYALTDATKKQIMKEYESKVRRIAQNCTDDSFNVIYPSMSSGIKFKDEQPQFQSEFSLK